MTTTNSIPPMVFIPDNPRKWSRHYEAVVAGKSHILARPALGILKFFRTLDEAKKFAVDFGNRGAMRVSLRMIGLRFAWTRDDVVKELKRQKRLRQPL